VLCRSLLVFSRTLRKRHTHKMEPAEERVQMSLINLPIITYICLIWLEFHHIYIVPFIYPPRIPFLCEAYFVKFDPKSLYLFHIFKLLFSKSERCVFKGRKGGVWNEVCSKIITHHVSSSLSLILD